MEALRLEWSAGQSMIATQTIRNARDTRRSMPVEKDSEEETTFLLPRHFPKTWKRVLLAQMHHEVPLTTIDHSWAVLP